VMDGLAGTLLVDDSLELADGLDEALALRARQGPGAMVVAARIEDAARAYRGLAAELRRNRCALLLRPEALDGEAVGIRLPPRFSGGPPGRGVLIGDPAWGDECAAGPVRVQVARAP
jgi:DNA segregation ATPase FtsK/SpoIIIE, S-DNA-T family